MNRNTIMSESEERYFEWLCDKVWIKGKKKCTGLLMELYSIPFMWVNSNDAHRAKDGEALRYTYSLETGMDADNSEPCSVLEMLIGLSRVIAVDVLGELYSSGRTAKWFWMMLYNMGIVDEHEDMEGGHYYIYDVLQLWMTRRFEPDGTGSPFPLKHPKEDQRAIEIWRQVCNYLVENPSLEGDSWDEFMDELYLSKR